MTAPDRLTVSATLVESMGSISRFEVTATLTVTVASLAEAVGAVTEALGDLA